MANSTAHLAVSQKGVFPVFRAEHNLVENLRVGTHDIDFKWITNNIFTRNKYIEPFWDREAIECE